MVSHPGERTRRETHIYTDCTVARVSVSFRPRYVVNPHSSHVGFEDANAHRVHVHVYVSVRR